jgi:hypothetical protein
VANRVLPSMVLRAASKLIDLHETCHNDIPQSKLPSDRNQELRMADRSCEWSSWHLVHPCPLRLYLPQVQIQTVWSTRFVDRMQGFGELYATLTTWTLLVSKHTKYLPRLKLTKLFSTDRQVDHVPRRFD